MGCADRRGRTGVPRTTGSGETSRSLCRFGVLQRILQEKRLRRVKGREGCSGRGFALVGLTPVCVCGGGPGRRASPTAPCSPGNPRAKTPSEARTGSVTGRVWHVAGPAVGSRARAATRLAAGSEQRAWLPRGPRPWAPSGEGAGSGRQHDGSEGRSLVTEVSSQSTERYSRPKGQSPAASSLEVSC